MNRFIEVTIGDNKKSYSMCISLNQIVSIKPANGKTQIKLTSTHKFSDAYTNDIITVDMEYDAFVQAHKIL